MFRPAICSVCRNLSLCGGPMKSKLRISEFAKLRGITTETLRHYDRVGLLKPVEVDKKTGYRYYSPFQSGILSTILDLKDLGFTIDEMKTYFSNRDIKKSHGMLCQKHEELLKKIHKLNEVEKSIAKKMRHLSEMMTLDDGEGYVVKNTEKQVIAYMDETIEGALSFEFVASDMETRLNALAPVIGSDAYGVITLKSSLLEGHPFKGAHLIYKLEDRSDIEDSFLKELPSRRVACFNLRGSLEDHKDKFKHMLEQIEKDGFSVGDEVIVYYRTDASVTEIGQEKIREYQVLIL